MQLKRTSILLVCCYLIVGVWVNVAVSNDVSFTAEYFDDDTATVIIPTLNVLWELWEGGVFTGNARLDAITSATEHRRSEVDAVTSATHSENRIQTSLGISQTWNLWNFSVSGYFSDEPDYQSQAVSFTVARDFAQRNTTISLSGNFGSDEITMAETDDEYLYDPDFRETADRAGGSLSITQVLSPSLVGRVSVSYSEDSGYQSSPYRYALLAEGVPEFDNRERLPDERIRYAVSARLNWYLKGIRGALHPAYRYYSDDWGINSHELNLKFLKYINPQTILGVKLRVYNQTEADYFQEKWSEPAQYMTSNPRYAAGNTMLGAFTVDYRFETEGTGVLAQLLRNLSVNGGAGYYYRDFDQNGGIMGQLGVSWNW